MERFFARKAAVDGNQTADPAGHTGFHGIPEAACYLSPVVKAPIRQDPEDIAINGWRTILLHYQRACESPSLLLQGVGMWVIPESRSEEHTSELQSLMRISYAVFCLKKKKKKTIHYTNQTL